MRANRLFLASIFGLIACAGVALAQSVGGTGFWNNWPIVGQSSYCATTTNGVCTSTISAGPTALTGRESVPANSGSSTMPSSILIPVGTLGANPVTVVSVTGTSPSGISASNLDGGVIYNATGTITSAAVTLPASPIQGQLYRISANRTITTLSVTPASGDSMAANTAPTVLTANTTGGPQGYLFYYNKSNTTWFRLQ